MNDFVQHVVYSKNERTVSIKTQLHAYELDLTRVDEEELLDMQKLFQRLNHDGNFQCLRLKALIVLIRDATFAADQWTTPIAPSLTVHRCAISFANDFDCPRPSLSATLPRRPSLA
ncbi:MAG: hypothetical protein IPN64_10880 [Propionivibrio sp.]|uniref:hypothetical protein n=1 Tax=Propionivibrio sp. TaxID=2212460 RepID=UPI0025E31963|nr:hypothetical protein [Propionivibrio sp.]MBK8894524.1 hypothetical protein [Propionivibrio sp.]